MINISSWKLYIAIHNISPGKLLKIKWYYPLKDSILWDHGICFFETIKKWKKFRKKILLRYLKKKERNGDQSWLLERANWNNFFNFVLRCILLIFYPFSGANASSKLNLFEQTVKWCSRGLKVSFAIKSSLFVGFVILSDRPLQKPMNVFCHCGV